MKEFLSQAAKLLKEHKLHRRQLKIFLCLAVIVAFGTVTALKLYGQAMTHQMEVLDCKYTVHEHTEGCYAKDEQGNPVGGPICGYADYVVHTHNEDCYDGKGNLVCTLEEHEKHEHTDECYEIERVLICGLEETGTEEPADDAEGTPEGEAPAAGTEGTPEAEASAAGTEGADAGSQPEADGTAAAEPAQEKTLVCQTEAHAHDEGCYENELSCGKEEHAHGEGCTAKELTCATEEHVHGEGCTAKELTCDTEEHAHTDGCYDAEGNLTCGMQEHAHGEGCYTTTYICGHEEHTHGEGCYTTTYTCGHEEHVHDDSCYTSNLICGKEEHEHTEGCYESVTVPAAADETAEPTEEAAPADGTADTDNGADAASVEPTEPESDATEESAPTGHVHTDECYEEVRTLICGKQELHVHDNSCYAPECFDEEGNLIEGSRPFCGLLQLEEHVHVHTDGEDSCFATVELTPEEVAALENGATLHIHTDECYDGEGNLICGHDATHVHMPQCYDDAGELICGYGTASHVHEDKCYDEDGNLICGYETASHVHQESCYDADGNLQCGYETAKHVHEESCYDADGNLTCGYETATHVHEDKCYDEEGNLTCGYETASHVHQESCYDADGNLQCGYETASHVHGKECYDEEGNLTCGYETAKHVHEESCYDEEGNLICGYDTASDTEDTVKLDATFNYETEGYTLEIHVQTDVPAETPKPDAPVESTTEGEAEGTEEKPESSTEPETPSSEEDSATAPTETESQPVTDDSAEEPTEEASASGIEEPTEEASVSGIEELSEVQEGDTDTAEPDTTVTDAEESQDGSEGTQEGTNPGEAEGQPEQDAQILIADEASGLTLKMSPLGAGGETYAEMASFVEGTDGSRLLDLSVMELHVYRDGKEIDITNCAVAVNITPKAATAEEMAEAYGEEAETEEDAGIMVSALQKTAEGVRQSGSVFLTPDMAEVPVLQNAVAENGILAIARYVNNSLITKTFQGENFIVTATYKLNANIPAEAELIAEQITEESESEHYAERQLQYQEALGDETATMRALMKIGFYVEDENGEFTKEVEPESPVTITIQFLDENGLEEGNPITVIHFAEEGTELLEGSKVQDNSTTFMMKSFSEIAVGYGVENVKVPLDEAIDYDTDAFHITFHIKGDVMVPVEEGMDEIEPNPEEGNQSEADSAEDNGDNAGEGESSVEPAEGEAEENGSGNGEDSQISGESLEDEENSDAVSNEGEHITGTMEGNVFTAPVKSEELEKDFEFKVESLDESSEEYAAVVAYGEEIGDEGEELLLQVWAYSLNYDGVEVDLSDCEVVAEITPTQALVDAAKEASAMLLDEPDDMGNPYDMDMPTADDESGIMGDSAEMADGSEPMENPEDQLFDDMEQQDGFTLSVMSFSTKTDIGNIETTDIKGDAIAAEIEPTVVALEKGYLAARASGQPNPKFTVQYYANLDILNKTGTNALPVIDTSGKKLPKNGKGTSASPNENAIKNIYVDGSGKVQTTKTVTEVYKSRPFEYHKAPSFNYINALTKNPNYKIKEIWVLKSGKKANSINRGDWDIYTYSTNLHFTNRSVSGTAKPGSNSGYVLIKDGATLRLVYDTTKAKPDFKAAFYDYDITSGHMYKNVTNAISNSGSGITQTGSQKNGTLYYTYTKEAGINSAGNYSGSGTKLAFGNVNTGTTMGENLWSGNLLNKYNGTQGGHPTVAGSYQGCTFGLVTGLTGGKIQYASGVRAPKLFNEGSATGKTSYDKGQYSLKFNRIGDTYTLTAVNGTGATGLESFGHPSPYEGKTHTGIWTNDFWPMDSAGSYGKDGHDIKFGSYEYRNNRAYAGSSTTGEPGSTSSSKKTYPYSDDGKDHNSYFGMTYAVEFELSEDYVGPLEYYFFGDDDMWVFLDNKLVCDIGGVHSSVGEYVNLWDYLKKGSKGKHTLTFFYTERGASGSTCWMQFTLPSVSSLTPETTDEDYGHLKIEKTVTRFENGEGTAVDNNDEFTFTINFKDKNGNKLPDDYSYVKYNKDGKEIGSDLIIWDGGEFTLKNGEYIIVQYLPQGTKYKVTEVNGAITITDNTSETSKVEYFTDITVGGILADDKKDLEDNKIAEGEIPKNNTTEVKYNNKFYVFALPETGGTGTILYTMAGGIIVLLGAGFLYKKKFRERRG